MKYYVFSVSEDGDVSITEHTKEELEKSMKDENWPNAELCRDTVKDRHDMNDPMAWGHRRYLIIKGEIVQPTAVQVVVEHKLP